MQKQSLHRKRTLVTGGAGFIGSHLVEALVQHGATVLVLDNLSTGNIKNLETVKESISLLQGSITDFETCLHATKDIELIFHLAAQVSVPESCEKPYHCYQTNVTGTYNLLEAARRNNAKRLIFSSSCAVYGQQQKPLSEDDPCTPASPYGSSKLLGELLCRDYTTYFNLSTVTLRYFNVYGARQSTTGAYSSAMANFRQKMSHNEPISIFGDGHQERDFVSVEQIVEANLVAAIASPETISGHTFNVASGKSTSILQLIQALRTEFPQFTGAITHRPPRAGDVRSVQANVSKYQTYLSNH